MPTAATGRYYIVIQFPGDYRADEEVRLVVEAWDDDGHPMLAGYGGLKRADERFATASFDIQAFPPAADWPRWTHPEPIASSDSPFAVVNKRIAWE